MHNLVLMRMESDHILSLLIIRDRSCVPQVESLRDCVHHTGRLETLQASETISRCTCGNTVLMWTQGQAYC